MDKNKIVEKAIYATLLRDAQLALSSEDFADEFMKKSKNDRLEIKKKMLAQIKQYSKEIASKYTGQVGDLNKSKKMKTELGKIIKRCLDETSRE